MNRIAENFAEDLKKRGYWEFASSVNRYVGDIHNHSGISYGYGSLENAIRFASSQLDFFSVTGHFAWPDMDDDTMAIPEDVKAYHRKGFAKLRRNWPEVKAKMKAAEGEGFIPFLSYEYHSFHYGDYTILCRSLEEDLPEEPGDGQPDERLRNLLEGGEDQQERFLCTPHHIGYKQGYRGINWDEFNEAVSPVVEICSMHGCAESMETRLKYMHTMGPRSNRNTYQGGLKEGHHFGVVGSTDHHNSAPGSYGSGRTVLYADSLNRDSVWNALRNRRTLAAVGDPFDAMLFAGGVFAGGVSEAGGLVPFDAYVSAFDKLEKVELVQDGRVVSGCYSFDADRSERGFVSLMFGWGKKHMPCVWDVEIAMEGCRLHEAVARFRGVDMVDPLDAPKEGEDRTPCMVRRDDGLFLHMVTDGNATAVTDSTMGCVLELEGADDARLHIRISAEWGGRRIEREYVRSIADFRRCQETEYIDGFVSPALEMGMFRNMGETLCHLTGTVDTSKGAVYLRAYEKNGDAVYTSPVSFR